MEPLIATGGGSISAPFVDPRRPSSAYREQKLAAHTTARRKRRGPGASARGLVQTLRAGAALLLAALPLLAQADTEIRAYKFDADSLTYTCPLVTERPVTRLITTSGASSATLTAVNDDAPFLGVAVGDALVLSVVDDTTGIPAGQVVRRVLTVTSDDEVVVDEAVTIPTAGRAFVWLDLAAATDSEAGWFAWSPSGDGEVFIGVDQLSATGGLDYKIEARQCSAAYCTPPIVLQTDNLTGASAAESVAKLALDKQFVDQLRVCFKLGTADDDVVTITGGSNDDIDFVEATASFTIDGTNDKIDYVEDALGTPKVCAGTVAHGTYTAASAVLELVDALDAPCLPDNTYTASYSAVTNKFTLTRVAGAKSVNFPWNTGTNTAVSVGPTIGFPTSGDSTGATTYTGAEVTTEFTATLTAGLYTGSAACAEVATQMNAVVGPTNTYACAYSAATDKITVSADGDFDLPWATGTSNATSADTALGFSADVSGAATYTGAAIGLDAANEVEKITVTVRK